MSQLTHLLLPLYAAGRLPRPLRGWLRSCLRTDVALRASYNGLRGLERTPDRALSAAQMRVLLQAILDDGVVAHHRRLTSSSTALVMSAVLALVLTATLFFSWGLDGQAVRSPSEGHAGRVIADDIHA